MKTIIAFFVTFLFIAFSCSTSSNKESADLTLSNFDNTEAIAIDTVSENYLLLKQQCLICHGGAISHDKLIAPPMIAVKRRYKMQYDSKEAFVNGMVAWATNPTSEQALMRGAVKEFNLMPKPATSEKDLILIAKFIYENELEEPEWFGAHFKKMQEGGGKIKMH